MKWVVPALSFVMACSAVGGQKAEAPTTFLTPSHQRLTPVGARIDLPWMRPQALALSPNGRMLAVSGKTAELVLLNPADGRVLQKVALPSSDVEASTSAASEHYLKPDKEAQLSYTGLLFSPDNRRIYLSSVNKSIKVFRIGPSNVVTAEQSFNLPPATAPLLKTEIPSGLALSPDGKRLYVVLNLSNRLAEMDAASGRVLRLFEVGVAPYDIILTRGKAYVSNWGGRRAEPGDLVGPAGRGTVVRVDPVRHIASEGSVTVVNLHTGLIEREILTGLHASALALSPSKRFLAVANSGSDTVSIIDTDTDEVVEKFWTRPSPADHFGAVPNAVCFDPSGKRLYVANGGQNNVAVIDFRPGKSRLAGFIPVGWFPAALVCSPFEEKLYVANLKGWGGRHFSEPKEQRFSSRQFFGGLSVIPLPSKTELAGWSKNALENFRYPALTESRLPARPGEEPRPVPERMGEPSVFKHVVYIIKENRTYDQVLGDVPAGNGEPSLCVFGENVTPNQHKLVREFVLLDNTYCSGILSADGHQWATTAFATEYLERSFAGFPRSYPDGMEDSDVDALAYSPAGFLWDNALLHGKSIRDYGEFAITEKSWKAPGKKGTPRFSDVWHDWTNGSKNVQISSRPAIESLRPYLCTNTVGWDLAVPDVFRAARFLEELRAFETKGEFPNLIIICLPNDHTSGTDPQFPTPEAQVADNDLAFGQIVEDLSRSRFWKETCIFAIEDDPQSGWDHVSGYRTTAYVISPYTRRRAVVSTPYNQVSMIRTMEQMLGLPPMNQLDAAAPVMSDCFTNVPDFTPFTAVPNRVPLDRLNPEPKRLTSAALRKDARVSSRLPLQAPDRCPEDVFNRILWRALKGPETPYPIWAVTEQE